MDSLSRLVEKNNNVSSKAIRKKVKNSESIALKRYYTHNSGLKVDLDKVLNDVYSSFRPVSADYDMRKDLVNSLNAMALDIYGNCKERSPVLEAYGSFVMDMFSSQSDLDVSINFGKGTSEMSRDTKVQVLRRFADKLCSLQGQGYVRNVVSILGAKVPIVKFFDQGTAVECDLSVENKDGILNSQIIRIISKIDDRFQKLCMLVKRWAKAHKINSALFQTLNSVSLTLLVAHHLQTQNPPILPPFSILFKDGIDPPNVERKTQNFLNRGSRNNESLSRLFATFFIKLQSVEFLWKQGLCASVMNGLWISKRFKKSVISIEDFTDVSQNVARRVNIQGATKIYGSINRTVEDIFEFLDGKISGTHLTHRLFSQQAVVESPHVPSLDVYPQQPQNNERIGYMGYIGLFEEHKKKLASLENNNRAVGGTGHGREDERYENPLGKRKRYAGNCNGFDGTSHVREEERYENSLGKRNNDRIGYIGYIGLYEEHQNKLAYLENIYRADEETSHGIADERYENPIGKPNRYAGNSNGFDGTSHGREEKRYENLIGQRSERIGYVGYIGVVDEHQNKRVCLENDRRRNDPPLPPYGRARYENFEPQPYYGRSFN